MAFLKARLNARLVHHLLHAAYLRLATRKFLFVNCCYGEQVASYRMASPAVSRKARKQNFSASEIAILTEKVEENLSIIPSKLTNSVNLFK